MKTNNLRLGNILNTPNGVGDVTGIQDRDVVEVSEIGYTVEEINPIPITEEWLLKVGFVLIEDKVEDFTYLSFMIPNEYNFEMYYSPEDGIINLEDFPLDIKYIHQLQNLYFALTNEELKIK